MIEFSDSFSQAAVAEAICAHPAFTKLISQQLMLPSFAYAHDVEGRLIGGPLVAPNPVLHKTTLFVSPRDMREHLPREINFARFRCTCNAVGQPVGEWQRVIVGAYVNHGSNDAPDWSSQTPTAPPMVPEAAITRLRAHIEEFIALALTHKLDAQLASLMRSGVLNLNNWDGANLVLPRTVTTALLEAAAERVIWHSHRRRYQRAINRLKQSL